MPLRQQDDLAGVVAEMFDDVENRVEDGLIESLRQAPALQRCVRRIRDQLSIQF
jgi:hypothetical protein